MRVVALFDIDGTLVDTRGAGRRAMEQAFERIVGDPEPLRRFRFAGMTDRAIVRSGLRGAGHHAPDRLIDAVLSAYVAMLPDELQKSAGYVVHPGVRELCARLDAIESVALGLGTGNVEPGARAKLAVGELNALFGFGGFGSDHEDRAELLSVGATRGAERLGRSWPSSSDGDDLRVVVIGDTPKDVAAAERIGACSIAVGTGGYEADALDGADLFVDDLTDGRVLSFLLD